VIRPEDLKGGGAIRLFFLLHTYVDEFAEKLRSE